ncbi:MULTISPECIES: hypothetical protein [unclassified Nocardioides]|uniref:hypothetical protein n=1 Tax=unclassified Nocardioides TaxID=2615069 RepID=UPI001054C3CC|nr:MULTISPECIES: hypothetical protein [unclassified Nocardioides]
MIIPEVRPLPGRDVANIVQLLKAQQHRVHEWVSGSADERLTRYHEWASQTADLLEGVLATDAVDRLIRTPRHDLMMSKATAFNVGMVNHTLNAESRWQDNGLQVLIDQLEAAAAA